MAYIIHFIGFCKVYRMAGACNRTNRAQRTLHARILQLGLLICRYSYKLFLKRSSLLPSQTSEPSLEYMSRTPFSNESIFSYHNKRNWTNHLALHTIPSTKAASHPLPKGSSSLSHILAPRNKPADGMLRSFKQGNCKSR